MRDAGNIVVGLGRHVHSGSIVGLAVIDEGRAAGIELHHHDGGVHAYVADFHLHIGGAGAVNLLGSEAYATDEGCGCVNADLRHFVVFPVALSVFTHSYAE